jgi:hypothetical protein
MKKIYLFGIVLMALLTSVTGKAVAGTPTITPSRTSLAFSHVGVGYSKVLSAVITGQDLTENITATITGPYLLSTDGVTFSSQTVTLTGSSSTLFVRFAPTSEASFTVQITLTSAGAVTKQITVYGYGVECGTPIPYSYTFNNNQQNGCWSIVDANQDGSTFILNTSYALAMYTYNDTHPADDWLISPRFQLNGHQLCRFKYRSSSSYYSERFQVFAIGTDTLPLTPVIETTDNAWRMICLDLSSLNGTYSIAFHCVSIADQYILNIENFNIEDISPNLVIHESYMYFPNTIPGMPSDPAQAYVTSTGTSGAPVTVSIPAPFEASIDGVTYSHALTFQRDNNAVQTDTFYVRYSPIFAEDTFALMTVEYAGLHDTAYLSGTLFDCQNSTPYTFNFDNNSMMQCWTMSDANQDGNTFNYSTYNHYAYYSNNNQGPADDWLISPIFTFDGTQYGFFDYKATSSTYPQRFQVFALGADTIALTPEINANKLSWTRELLDLSTLSGIYRIGFHCNSDANSYSLRFSNFNIQPIVPAISILQDTLTYSLTPMGDHSPTQQAFVTTIGIHSPIVVTAPSHFEVSIDGDTFNSSLTIPGSANNIRLDTLYIRFAPTAADTFALPLTVQSEGVSDTLILTGSSRDCNAIVPIPFEESFEGDFNYCWKTVNNSGGGNGWVVYNSTSSARTGKASFQSTHYWDDYLYESFVDNWLISQPVAISDTAVLSFYVKNENHYSVNEQFTVYVSTSGNNVEDFTTELFSSSTNYSFGMVYIPIQVSLADYVGQTIYLAFRHHGQDYRLYLDDIAIATTQDHPLLSVSATDIDYETVGIGEEVVKTVTVNGTDITGNITASVDAPFALSTDGITFSDSVTLPPAGGTLLIRFSPTNTPLVQKYVRITSSSTGVQEIYLRGQGIDCYNTIPYTHNFNNSRNSCWTPVDANGDGTYFVFNPGDKNVYYYSHVEGDDWLLSPSFQFDGNQYSFVDYNVAYSYYDKGQFQIFGIWGSDTIVLTPSIDVRNTQYQTLYYDLSPLQGRYQIGIHCTSPASHNFLKFTNFNIDNISPTLIFSSDTLDMSDVVVVNGNPPTEVVLTSLGVNSATTLSVTAPLEISTDGITYSSTFTLPADSTVVIIDTLFVRVSDTTTGNFTGKLYASATGAADSIVIFGNVFECQNTIPYTHTFNNDLNKCWNIVNANNDEKTFAFNTSQGYAYYNFNQHNGADDWLISPPFELNGYQRCTFEYRNLSSSPEKFQVFALGADTIPLTPIVTVTNNYYLTQECYLAGISGPYSIGIHCVSDANKYQFMVKNFAIQNFDPNISFNKDTLDYGECTTNTGTVSVQNVILTSVGISTPVTLSVPEPFEISLNGIDYSTSLTIPKENTGLTNDTILVRLTAYDGVEISGSMLTATVGDLEDSVTLTCTVIECPNDIPYSYNFTDNQLNKCWTSVNANNDYRYFSFNTTNGYAYYNYTSSSGADDWLISPVFHLNGNQYGSFDYRCGNTYYTERFEVAAIGMGDTVMLVPPKEISNYNFSTQLFDLSSLNGDYQIGIHCISDPDQYTFYVSNFIVDNFVPTLTVNEEQVNFGENNSHVFPEAQELVITGTGVFAPITVTAPTGFEVSVDGVTYSGSMVIPAHSKGFTTDTFYVRLNPATEGFYDGLLIVSATSCADTVQLHGSIFYCEDPLTLPYTEDFEDALSTCWLIHDYDGDDESWIPSANISGATGHQSANAYASLANTGIAYNGYQQNFLVTPMFVPTENTVLAFFTMGSEGIPQDYKVYISDENSVTGIYGGTLVLSATAETTWKENALSLADYAGDSIYVSFKHNDVNEGALFIDDIVITDNLDHAVVLVDSNSLSFGSVILGESATKQLEITTFGLHNSTTAFSSIHYLLSVDGTNFSQVATIPASGCTLYVRYTPATENLEEGTITIFVPGSQSFTVALSGHGFDCLNTIPYSYQFNDNYISCWSVENSNGDNKTFTFETDNSRATYHYSSQNAADDWLISPSFQFNGNQYGHFDYYCNSSNFHERFEVLAIGADTVLIVAPMVINNTTAQTLNLDLSGLSGEYSIAIHCISNPNQYNFYIENFNILNVTPSITVEQDSLEFTLIPLNGTSGSQAVVVSSIGVTTPLTATVPAPFEVSSDNLNFGHSATIPAVSDLFAHDTFYVRFAPTVVGLSENTLTITTGSLQETVVLSGTSRDCDEVLTLPVVESFEGPDSYCWTSYDEDGDGFSWNNDYTNYTHSGSQSASSDSYISGTGALNPDNWLVSQPIQLPEIPARLSFWVKETYSGYTHEHYSVYVSTTGSAPADFTEVVFTDNATTTFEQHSVSLRNYAGQTVRIAFRHHASYDLLRFVLDDIDIRLDTVPQRPLVVTDSVFSITQMSAVCIGHTVFDGNSPVTASGFVWGTSPEPTVADNVVNATPGLPTMIGMLNGLSEHHTYYVRAFATNSIGTEYGEEIVFTTLCGPATYTSFNQSACESFTWNDSTYFESGNYTQNLTNMIGCDSIVTMHLTIHHGNTTAFSVTECESYTWNNITYEQSGDFTQSFTNIHGCDSTVTLHLTIHHGNTTAFSVTECDSYTWNGTEYQQSGDYNQTFANIHGCDSVVTLHLTLNYATSTEFADTACNVFAWNDSIYSETGDYIQHFETVHGCDSTVTLHLTIHNSDSTEFAATECESFVWNDTTYTQSGDYNQTFANIHGCDSVVTLHLTIHHGDSTEFAAAECESYVWNDTTYTQSGDYTQTFANIHGCDSVVTLHLTVYPAVSSEETVAWPDSCYLWNGEELCESGSYTQTLTTVHGCDSTVTLHLTITVGMEDFVMDNDLRVYPNPTNGLLNVSAMAFTDVQLFDAYGKLVGRWHTNGEVTQIDLSQHATGIYFVKVLNQNQVVGVKKVLKQ